MTDHDLGTSTSQQLLPDGMLATIAATIAPELECLLVIGHGSWFRGEAGPRSDIDLIWLTRSASLEKKRIVLPDHHVEVTHVGLRGFVHGLEQGHAVYVPAAAEGRYLQGDPKVAELVRSKALERFRAGPTSEESKDGWRRRVTTLWDDILDVTEDEAMFCMLQTNLLNALYQHLCAERKIWKRGLKHMFADIERCEPGLSALFRAALVGPSVEGRLALTRALLDRSDLGLDLAA